MGIDAEGSLTRAAFRVGIPYRRAWQILRDASRLAGGPLVETVTGGSGGGSSVLSATGRTFLRRVQAMVAGLPSVEDFGLERIADLPPPPDFLMAASTEPVESGLVDELLAGFRSETGYAGACISVGSGTALAALVEGRVDIALTHAPQLEERLAAEGLVADRRPLMTGEFSIVGPAEDPAGIGSLEGAPLGEMLRRIQDRGASYVSRGDRSGTHLREIAARQSVGLGLSGPGVVGPAGPGSRGALDGARDRLAYTLVDPVARDIPPGFRVYRPADGTNPYALLVGSRAAGGVAGRFLDWACGPAGAGIISSFDVSPCHR